MNTISLNCNTCGGNLSHLAGEQYKCIYCGGIRVIAQGYSNEELTLLQTADTARQHFKRYDSAIEHYEAVLKINPHNTTAWWGLFLAEYGIEYVKDYDGVFKPTLHRLSSITVANHRALKKVIELTSDAERQRYIKEANDIEAIRVSSIQEAQKNAPYDIFICYKDTLPNNPNQKTQESAWALEYYNEFYRQGYKVFYAPKSIPAGSLYEPTIFKALHTAKFMIILTSDAEHLESPWVANEWSRFVARRETQKHLGFCVIHSGIDPYTLPNKLQKNQALNHNSISCLKDLEKSVKATLALSARITAQNIYAMQQQSSVPPVPQAPVATKYHNVSNPTHPTHPTNPRNLQNVPHQKPVNKKIPLIIVGIALLVVIGLIAILVPACNNCGGSSGGGGSGGSGWVDPNIQTSEPPVGLTATFGDTLAHVALPANWQWVHPNHSVGAVGHHGHELRYARNNAIVMVLVTVVHATPVYSIPEIHLPWGSRLGDWNLPVDSIGGFWEWVHPHISVGIVEQWHNHQIRFVPLNPNFMAVERTIRVFVHPAEPEFNIDPLTIVGRVGQTLNQIELPQGWTWFNPDNTIDGLWNTNHRIEFIPTNNNFFPMDKWITITVVEAVFLLAPINLRVYSNRIVRWDRNPSCLGTLNSYRLEIHYLVETNWRIRVFYIVDIRVFDLNTLPPEVWLHRYLYIVVHAEGDGELFYFNDNWGIYMRYYR